MHLYRVTTVTPVGRGIQGNGAMTGQSRVLRMPGAFLDALGGMAALALEGARRTWDIRRWWREFLDQCDFLAGVTIMPVMFVAIPFGAVISLQIGQLVAQLGAQSLTGAAAVTGMVQQTRSKKVLRIRNDDRACLLVEQGAAWVELAAVELPARAVILEPGPEADRISGAFADKYAAHMPAQRGLPDATKEHYSGQTIIRLDPAGDLLTWNNAKLRIGS